MTTTAGFADFPDPFEPFRRLREQQARIAKVFETPAWLRQVRALQVQQARMLAFPTPGVRLLPEQVTRDTSEPANVQVLDIAALRLRLDAVEGRVRALEVVAAVLVGIRMIFHAPIPTAVLAILGVVVTAAKFGLWAAKRRMGE